jgi:predicted acetylornithine/succinylornithine family transaminase
MSIIPPLNQAQVLDWYQTYVMRTYGRVPIAFERGEGAYLWDMDGKRYLDFVSGGRAGTALGHRHPKVIAAMQEQMERLLFLSNDFHHPPGAALGRMLSDRSGGRVAFFCNSGTEASETAIKLARKWGHTHGGPAKHEIITFERGFHGRTMGSISATAQTKFQQGFEPVLPGFKYLPFNDLQALKTAIGRATCAVYVEPVQGESGIYPASTEFMQGAAELCAKNQCLFMVDEVQTGFGRTGKFWAYEHYGVEPDVVATAKALAGGLPIGACLSKPDCAALVPGDHGCTFGGNPLSAAAAVGALQALDEGHYIENAARQGAVLKERLKNLVPDKLAEVRGLGLMIGVDLKEPKAKAVFDACLAAGLVVNPVGDTILRLLPPVIVTDEQVNEGASILEAAIRAV